MSGTITRAAYQQLVDEDICWLERQPRTLERDHVIDIVRHSVEVYYGELRDLRAQVAQLESKLAQSTNYVADHETFPTCVWFANGRRVSVNAAGVLEIGFGNQLEACDERQPV